LKLLLFIIIIINVLIKVTLSVIRCRGTLQSQWSTLIDSTSRKAEEMFDSFTEPSKLLVYLCLWRCILVNIVYLDLDITNSTT